MGSQLTTVGLGLYPINYGWWMPDQRLFPYVSAGLVLNYGFSTKYSSNGNPDIAISAKGAVLQLGRLAAGLKFRPINGLNLGAELGFTPYTLAGVVDTDRLDSLQKNISGTNPPPPLGSVARGGAGTEFDASLLIEWM